MNQLKTSSVLVNEDTPIKKTKTEQNKKALFSIDFIKNDFSGQLVLNHPIYFHYGNFWFPELKKFLPEIKKILFKTWEEANDLADYIKNHTELQSDRNWVLILTFIPVTPEEFTEYGRDLPCDDVRVIYEGLVKFLDHLDNNNE